MNKQDRYVPEPFRPLGISFRQLDYWCRRGYLKPIGDGEGSGHPRWWPPQEIAVAGRIVALLNEGFRLDVAAQRARADVSSEPAALHNP